MSPIKQIKYVFLLVALVFIGILVYKICQPAEPRRYTTDTARVKSIKEMVNLCSLDFYEEVPFKDSINDKWIVAAEKIQGSVKFDLEKLRIEERGDTTFVFLPPEKIEIYESTEPGAYRIIDNWDSRRPVFGRTLTDKEENILKQRLRKRLEKQVYARGYVKRAHDNAIATLTPLFNSMHGPFGRQSPVIIMQNDR